MIQMAVRNKYRFNMQVSARAMAAPWTARTSGNAAKKVDICTTGAGMLGSVHINVFLIRCVCPLPSVVCKGGIDRRLE
jgi:hypothetical protein